MVSGIYTWLELCNKQLGEHPEADSLQPPPSQTTTTTRSNLYTCHWQQFALCFFFSDPRGLLRRLGSIHAYPWYVSAESAQWIIVSEKKGWQVSCHHHQYILDYHEWLDECFELWTNMNDKLLIWMGSESFCFMWFIPTRIHEQQFQTNYVG